MAQEKDSRQYIKIIFHIQYKSATYKSNLMTG